MWNWVESNHAKNNGFFLAFIWVTLALSCQSQSKLLRDKVVLKDGSQITGNTDSSDTNKILVSKSDGSNQWVLWDQIDSIVPYAHRTRISSVSLGIYNTPYYSVFKNENYNPGNLGLQFRTGIATMGKRYRFVQFTTIPSQPFPIRKLGLGQEFYKKGNYYEGKNWYWGYEANLMFVKYNNGPQLTAEPFIGRQWQYKDQMRIQARFGLQFNLASKNENTGFHLGLGISYLHKKDAQFYTNLNQNHVLK